MLKIQFRLFLLTLIIYGCKNDDPDPSNSESQFNLDSLRESYFIGTTVSLEGSIRDEDLVTQVSVKLNNVVVSEEILEAPTSFLLFKEDITLSADGVQKITVSTKDWSGFEDSISITVNVIAEYLKLIDPYPTYPIMRNTIVPFVLDIVNPNFTEIEVLVNSDLFHTTSSMQEFQNDLPSFNRLFPGFPDNAIFVPIGREPTEIRAVFTNTTLGITWTSDPLLINPLDRNILLESEGLESPYNEFRADIYPQLNGIIKDANTYLFYADGITSFEVTL